MRGCDDLRAWLEGNGFRFWKGHFASQGNECDWYAVRKSSLDARPCECNSDKLVQIVVKPMAYTRDGVVHESVTVEVCGEAGGIWFKQDAYGLSTAEVMDKLDAIEGMLISAWNALLPLNTTR